MTKASASETRTLDGLLSRTFEETPVLAGRCTDLSADRGYDSEDPHGHLGIRPVIDTRAMWRDEKAEPGRDRKATITRPLDPEKADTMVFTERGEVCCLCPATDTERPLAFHGFETDRGSLSGRGPMASTAPVVWRVKPPGGGGRTKGYGRIVRVPLDRDCATGGSSRRCPAAL